MYLTARTAVLQTTCTAACSLRYIAVCTAPYCTALHALHLLRYSLIQSDYCHHIEYTLATTVLCCAVLCCAVLLAPSAVLHCLQQIDSRSFTKSKLYLHSMLYIPLYHDCVLQWWPLHSRQWFRPQQWARHQNNTKMSLLENNTTRRLTWVDRQLWRM